MPKKILAIFCLILIASCQSNVNSEAVKSGKSSAASGRINSSESNSKDIFKELDE